MCFVEFYKLREKAELESQKKTSVLLSFPLLERFFLCGIIEFYPEVTVFINMNLCLRMISTQKRGQTWKNKKIKK